MMYHALQAGMSVADYWEASPRTVYALIKVPIDDQKAVEKHRPKPKGRGGRVTRPEDDVPVRLNYIPHP